MVALTPLVGVTRWLWLSRATRVESRDQGPAKEQR
jgi:hypothetical protein